MSTSTISWDSYSCRNSRRGFRGRRHDSVREPDALEAHVRFDERDVETGFMVRTVRHRQSKEAATDMPDLQNYRATSRLYPFSKRTPVLSVWFSRRKSHINAGKRRSRPAVTVAEGRPPL